MNDIASSTDIKLMPPQGERDQADKYLHKLITLLDQNKIKVVHTDLKKFDLASLEDHYSISLDNYEVEVSHTKQPDTGKDFYIILFNNLKRIQANGESCTNKLILAYIHLTQEQFQVFRSAAQDFLERRRKEEDSKRFKEVMEPINQILDNLGSGQKNNQETREKFPKPFEKPEVKSDQDQTEKHSFDNKFKDVPNNFSPIQDNQPQSEEKFQASVNNNSLPDLPFLAPD